MRVERPGTEKGLAKSGQTWTLEGAKRPENCDVFEDDPVTFGTLDSVMFALYDYVHLTFVHR